MTDRRAFIALAGYVAICLGVGLSSGIFRSTSPMATQDRPIVTIKARVLDSMVRYIEANQLYDRTDFTDFNRREDLRSEDHHDSFVDYLTARASDRSIGEDPGGIVIHYDHPTCPVVLPAGRQFKFSHVGGHIDEIEAIFPLEPLSWDDMQIDLQAMIKQLDDAGWVRTTGHFTSKTPVQENITFDAVSYTHLTLPTICSV